MLENHASDPRPKRAVVIGGSIAGLLAAKALSGFFEQVVILDRDQQPEEFEPRKGVPQGCHAHLLLRRGALVLDEMYPGLLNELRQNGASFGDWGERVRWFHFGAWKARYKSNWEVAVMTRPFLEGHIRRRMEAIDNVAFRYQTQVKGFTTDPELSAINGVRILSNKGEDEVLAGDLVVDASGRASQTPKWLEKMGFSSIDQTTVGIGLGYSSRLYEAPKQGDDDWVSLMIYPHPPIQTDAGYIMKVENGCMMVTMAGYLGHHPRSRDPYFLDFSRRLGTRDIYRYLKDAKPLSEIKTYRYTREVRNHYEKATQFPNGLIVVGDASCSFDPVFGQGMTVAAMGAQILQRELESRRHSSGVNLKNLPAKYHRRIARIINTPWLLATSEAFRWPLTEGKRMPGISFLQWYTGKIFVLSHKSPKIYDALLNVLHMMSSPISLFKPGILMKVALSCLGSFMRSWLPVRVEPEADPLQK